MTITVTTQSGTIYTFTQENGQTLFCQGTLSGRVVHIDPITIGKEIHMNFYKELLYGGFENFTTLINSSPVTEISVIL